MAEAAPVPESAPAVAHKRIFLALWPDEAVRRRLHACQQQLRAEPGLQSALATARAVTPANLHITLHFIGSVPIDVVQNLMAALDAVQGEAFEMQVNTAGYFPRPRVLWLGLAQIPPALPVLVRQTAAVVQQCVEGYDYQTFQPHITLFRKAKKPAALEPPLTVCWPVTGFALVESKTLPEGVRYEVLKQWRLSPEDLISH